MIDGSSGGRRVATPSAGTDAGITRVSVVELRVNTYYGVLFCFCLRRCLLKEHASVTHRPARRLGRRRRRAGCERGELKRLPTDDPSRPTIFYPNDVLRRSCFACTFPWRV